MCSVLLAVAVAAPALSTRDRLVVTGPAGDAIPLVRDVLREVGPAYRPLGDRGLIDAQTARNRENIRFVPQRI